MKSECWGMKVFRSHRKRQHFVKTEPLQPVVRSSRTTACFDIRVPVGLGTAPACAIKDFTLAFRLHSLSHKHFFVTMVQNDIVVALKYEKDICTI